MSWAAAQQVFFFLFSCSLFFVLVFLFLSLLLVGYLFLLVGLQKVCLFLGRASSFFLQIKDLLFVGSDFFVFEKFNWFGRKPSKTTRLVLGEKIFHRPSVLFGWVMPLLETIFIGHCFLGRFMFPKFPILLVVAHVVKPVSGCLRMPNITTTRPCRFFAQSRKLNVNQRGINKRFDPHSYGAYERFFYWSKCVWYFISRLSSSLIDLGCFERCFIENKGLHCCCAAVHL